MLSSEEKPKKRKQNTKKKQHTQQRLADQSFTSNTENACSRNNMLKCLGKWNRRFEHMIHKWLETENVFKSNVITACDTLRHAVRSGNSESKNMRQREKTYRIKTPAAYYLNRRYESVAHNKHESHVCFIFRLFNSSSRICTIANVPFSRTPTKKKTTTPLQSINVAFILYIKSSN